MSHFSKIKTNISNKNILINTLHDMGFMYKYSRDSLSSKDILVYDGRGSKSYLFSFVWNDSQYNLLADLQLWSLDVDFNYFLDSLSQMYAYNMVVDQSTLGGFHKVNEEVMTDGSIRVKLKRWSTSNFC
uniref:Uncharacterized protein ycf35 n=1 Tax=Laurencieae sp. TaxID=2007162 RepID=A0A1Z1M274_9FLOR|nr:hypothetical protein [Laurencieae sp.]